jgi:hypothetical protein
MDKFVWNQQLIKSYHSLKMINTRTGEGSPPMRYNHIRKFVEELEKDQAANTIDRAQTGSKNMGSNKSGNELKNKAPDTSKPAIKNPSVEQFINNCIPSEANERDEQEAREWLHSQIKNLDDLSRYNANQIRLSLRQIGMLDPNENIRLADYTIDEIIKLKPAAKTNMGDGAAISRLMSVSKRVSQDVIMTVMSGLDDDTLTMDQGLYDTLAYYIGQRFNAKRIETAVDRKFRIDHGVFVIFRNIRNASAYINILIDTDRHLIRGGRRIDGMTMLTVGIDHRFNSDAFRRIVMKRNDGALKVLFDTVDPILIELQEMMNDDNAAGVYEYLGVRFEEDEREAIQRSDPELVNRIVSV